jgi:hypothetical protein
MDVWDFQLSEEDHKAIAALDVGHSEIVNHYDPAFVQMLPRLENSRLTAQIRRIISSLRPVFEKHILKKQKPVSRFARDTGIFLPL